MDETILRQVGRLSRPFLILLTIALGLIVVVQGAEIAAMLFLFHGGDGWRAAVSSSAAGISLSIAAATDAPAGAPLEALSLGQRAALALLAALCAASAGFAVFHLRQLFALYARGEIFAQANISHIKRFGLWLAASGVVVNVAGRLFAVVTGEPSHGLANAVMALVFGGMTYVVARVMELGRQADVERREFV